MKLLKWKIFLEKVGSIPIIDIQSYIDGMGTTSLDKLFFLSLIKPDVIVDFGCANGFILSKIKEKRPNIKLIGYDLDEDMLSKAKSLLGDEALLTNDWNEVVEELKKYKAPALVLSSVIHEVYSYSHSLVIKEFWNKQVFGGNFKWICIRDMIPSGDMLKHSKNNFINAVRKVRKVSDSKVLESFEKRWGKISNNYRTFIHFLLKYKYTENWDREVSENYVPLTLETLYKKMPSKYKIVYQDNFILPYLMDQVKKDFGIKIDHTTHTKMIIKNLSFEKKINESKTQIYNDIELLEDLFLEYIDKWNMKHGKYISDPLSQNSIHPSFGRRFFDSDLYNLWYTIYPSFNSKIARLYVPSDSYIELNIEAHTWKGDVDRDELFSDIDKFLVRIEKYGWKWVESKTCNKKTFLNTKTGVGEVYNNSLRYYLYK